MPAIVVVGAGPAGCAAALSAARLPNAHVKILEKRPLDALLGSAASPRAYPMVLSGRALKVLESLDLDLPSMREPYHGITFVPGGAEMRFADPRRNRLVSRDQVCLNMLREVAQHDNIMVHFGASPAAIDFDQQVVQLLDTDAAKHDCSSQVLQHIPESGAPPDSTAFERAADSSTHDSVASSSTREPALAMSVSSNAASAYSTALAVRAKGWVCGESPGQLQFDLLIGADGAHSKVRSLAQQALLLKADTTVRATNHYKTFTDVTIPPGANTEGFPFAAPDLPPCQNLFFIPSQAKDIDLKLVVWRSDSNHICGMVPGVASEAPETRKRLDAAFGTAVPPWMLDQIEAQLAPQACASFGSVVSCSALHTRGSVVLLGDAAHAVTSTLGQGCNMALESVGVFHRLLAEKVATGELPLCDAPAAFTRARCPDVHAMQRLEELSNVAQGVAPARTPSEALHARVAFGSAIIIGTLQWKLLPHCETLPLYRMLYDEDTPYSDILAYVNRTALGMYVVLASAVGSIGISFLELEGWSMP